MIQVDIDLWATNEAKRWGRCPHDAHLPGSQGRSGRGRDPTHVLVHIVVREVLEPNKVRVVAKGRGEANVSIVVEEASEGIAIATRPFGLVTGGYGRSGPSVCASFVAAFNS